MSLIDSYLIEFLLIKIDVDASATSISKLQQGYSMGSLLEPGVTAVSHGSHGHGHGHGRDRD